MKVGDLIIRKVLGIPGFNPEDQSPEWQRKALGHGVILTKQMSGNPVHPCITVYYPMTGEMYDIAEALVEVISAGR
jgi:hypothetical protein